MTSRLAAEAFARFRLDVIETEDLRTLRPERVLLGAIRTAAARRAPLVSPAGGGLRLRRADERACALVPQLLAARAEKTLTAADAVRLERLLERHPEARAAAERLRTGERAYRDAPDDAPPAYAMREIMRAMLRLPGPEAAEPEEPPLPPLARPPEVEPLAARLPEPEPEPEPPLVVEPEPEPVAEPEPEPIADPEPAPIATATLADPVSDGHTTEFAAAGDPPPIPSDFAARQRPAKPEHPALRVAAPVGVALTGLLVALAAGGAFGSSGSGHPVAAPFAEAVTTPLPATRTTAEREPARTTTTTATTTTSTTTTASATTTATTPATVAAPQQAAATPAPTPTATPAATPTRVTTPQRQTAAAGTPTDREPPASKTPKAGDDGFSPAQPAGR